MNLNLFLNQGIKVIADTAGRYYLNNIKGRKYILGLMSDLRKDMRIRGDYEKRGIHIPPFLIASISAQCNLHCAGCYARASGSCVSLDEDNVADVKRQLTDDDWKRIFQEASDLGISFILLAGGEPLLRKGVIKAAAAFSDMVFPIFTNGTLIDEDYMTLFAENPGLVPVISVEGGKEATDLRRGRGVFEKVSEEIDKLWKNGVMYGVSITVTRENFMDVTDEEYVKTLKTRGCGVIFYVEYVPVEEDTDHLVLTDADLLVLQQRVDGLKSGKTGKAVVILSFPGDEEKMGGCLAAGRGFFHINQDGGAEPCPFSPYWAVNLKETTLLQTLQSPFFEKVRKIEQEDEIGLKGGCTLFRCEEQVQEALTSLYKFGSIIN